MTSIDELFDDIVRLFSIRDEKTKNVLFQLSEQELKATWETFPAGMQSAIWETIAKRIEKYGK